MQVLKDSRLIRPPASRNILWQRGHKLRPRICCCEVKVLDIGLHTRDEVIVSMPLVSEGRFLSVRWLLICTLQVAQGTVLEVNARQLKEAKEAARRSTVDVQACRETLKELALKHEEHEQQAAQLATARQSLLRQQLETHSQANDSWWAEAVKHRAHLTLSDADIAYLCSTFSAAL